MVGSLTIEPPPPARWRRLQLRQAGVVAIVLLLAACDLPLPGPTAPPTLEPSGIRGIVLLGPTCAGMPRKSPCIKPYVARLLILDEQDRQVADVTSGEDGRFELSLPPGDYLIQPTPGGDPVPNARPVPVSVTEGDYVDVEIDYDTGVR